MFRRCCSGRVPEASWDSLEASFDCSCARAAPLPPTTFTHSSSFPPIPSLQSTGFPQSVLQHKRRIFFKQVLTFRPRRGGSSHGQSFHSNNMGAWKRRLHGAVSEFFEIEKRHSTVATEVRAGITTFLTMSYILLVNPQILAQVRSRRKGWGGRGGSGPSAAGVLV